MGDAKLLLRNQLGERESEKDVALRVREQKKKTNKSFNSGVVRGLIWAQIARKIRFTVTRG